MSENILGLEKSQRIDSAPNDTAGMERTFAALNGYGEVLWPCS